ncbi:hypothetical protein [Streptomyces lunaelactis]|uniref:hypothetical protein n=1 Tax=Streptomyces lunaelactis TaxID=1535768 RepID=UPI00131F3AF3|nr:hypothetical protein [Streptomyces lunaelactis]NUK88875.1 hypothetical protein [Streptomyces lunaelactis]
MNLVTMAVTYDTRNPGRVPPPDEAAHQVWDALRVDRPIPKSAAKNSVGDEGTRR